MRIGEQLERGEGLIWRWWFTFPAGLAMGLTAGFLLKWGLGFLLIPPGALAFYIRLRYGWPPFATAVGLWGTGAFVLISILMAFVGYALIA